MKNHLQDIAEVRAVVQLYIDGANGDAAKLREAFHADARMFGHIGDAGPLTASNMTLVCPGTSAGADFTWPD